MKDIKVNKKIEKHPTQENTHPQIEPLEIGELTTPKNVKRQYSLFSGVLFTFMFMSISTYIFLISSSVFYAVKESQFTYKSEKITNTISTVSNVESSNVNNIRDRISYVNVDSDISISLK